MRLLSLGCTLLLPALAWLLGYFGAPNPHDLGAASGLLVSLLGVFLLLLAALCGRWLYSSAVVLLAVGLLILTCANWWHFSFFQVFFSYQSLALLGDAPESVRAISVFPYVAESVVYAAISLVLVGWGIRSYRTQWYRSKIGVLLLSIVVPLIWDSYTRVGSSLERYRALNMLQLIPSYLHPAHAFFVGMDFGVENEQERKGYEFFRDKNRIGLTQSDVRAGRYNVIVVTLESVRADMLGFYGASYGVTPNFDEFARQHVAARNFYASSNYTIKGETSIWCGIYDNAVLPPIAKYASAINRLDCLPSILKTVGYQTHYFHGNSGRFYSRRDYLPIVGFDELHFYADEQKVAEADKVGWGVSDRVLYKQVLDRLGRLPSEQPFFASVMTLSSHYPFSWRWGMEMPSTLSVGTVTEDKLFADYKRAIYYQDYAFGEFWRAFKESPLASNTILAVTADHGVWVYPRSEDDPVRRDEMFFRIPFFMYHPAISGHLEIDSISSQVDIAPTLLDMLGARSSTELVGKNMLNASPSESWSVMMKSGAFYVRTAQGMCFTAQADCAGLHQSCISAIDGELVDGAFVSSQRCVEYEGDLLRGGSYSRRDEETSWVSSAVGLVNYQNKGVFGGGEALRRAEPSTDPGLSGRPKAVVRDAVWVE